MNIKDQYSTFEQGKCLLELGVGYDAGTFFWMRHRYGFIMELCGKETGAEKADEWYDALIHVKPFELDFPVVLLQKTAPNVTGFPDNPLCVPAFSVAEMGRMLMSITDNLWMPGEEFGFGHSAWGWVVNGERVAFETEAECRAQMLIGAIMSVPANDLLSRLPKDDILTQLGL